MTRATQQLVILNDLLAGHRIGVKTRPQLVLEDLPGLGLRGQRGGP